ncbi:MAG: FAD-binding oxidoreductase [Microthrixaceae bacterium]
MSDLSGPASSNGAATGIGPASSNGAETDSDPDFSSKPVLLSGWGRTTPALCDLVSTGSAEGVARAVTDVGERGIIARGLGRAYGDCAQNAGGSVLDGPKLRGVIDVDLANGIVRAHAGTSLDDLMKWFVPLGLFVPVTPGTRSVTVGGAIAADIHGKNHHAKGSWGNHVVSFRLLDGHGAIRDVSPITDPGLFWATMGGMGLTGIVLDATIKMSPIESAYLMVDTDRTNNLDEVMTLMVEGDEFYEYSVAWIDLIAKGRNMGRSILERGHFATEAEVTSRGKHDPHKYSTHQLVSPPDVLPSGLLNHLTIRAFNEVWYRKSPKKRRDHLATIEGFFHPLDMIDDWNRMYGPRGFLQWQTVLPDSATDVLRVAVERLSNSGASSFLAVLKRFGPGNQGHLSFPAKGWTLALDIPVSPELHGLLDELDEMIVEAGGRIYLAKDSRVRPELIPVMYPRLDEWREIRDKVDPDRKFRSDMSRRLNLI